MKTKLVPNAAGKQEAFDVKLKREEEWGQGPWVEWGYGLGSGHIMGGPDSKGTKSCNKEEDRKPLVRVESGVKRVSWDAGCACLTP